MQPVSGAMPGLSLAVPSFQPAYAAWPAGPFVWLPAAAQGLYLAPIMDSKVNDIQSLKAAISMARPTPPGQPLASGDVFRILSSCSFIVGDKGFTSMIQMLGKAKEWRKALEVFEFLRQDPQYRWALNTYTFTTAIAACGISGRWREAEELFSAMKDMSQQNSHCAPNTVTYSALISAYTRADAGIQVDKILAVYKDMKTAHLQPDAITFSALISACDKGGRPLDAVRILDEAHQEGFFLTTPVYNSVLHALAAKGLSDKATEVFLGMQLVQIEPNLATYHALMLAYKNDGKWEACQQLLSEMEEAGCRPDPEAYALAAEAAAEAEQVSVALDILEQQQVRHFTISGSLAAAIVDACNREGSGRYTDRLRKLGLLPPTSARPRGGSHGVSAGPSLGTSPAPSSRGTPTRGTPNDGGTPRTAHGTRSGREGRGRNPPPYSTR